MWYRYPIVATTETGYLSRYIGRLPEGKKKILKTQIRQELDAFTESSDPDLRLVVTADGEKAHASNPCISVSIRQTGSKQHSGT